MIVPLQAKILVASRTPEAPLNTPLSSESLESFSLVFFFFYSLIEKLKDI